MYFIGVPIFACLYVLFWAVVIFFDIHQYTKDTSKEYIPVAHKLISVVTRERPEYIDELNYFMTAMAGVFLSFLWPVGIIAGFLAGYYAYRVYNEKPNISVSKG